MEVIEKSEAPWVGKPPEAAINAMIDAGLKQRLDDAVYLHRRCRTKFGTQRACLEAALREWLAKNATPKAEARLAEYAPSGNKSGDPRPLPPTARDGTAVPPMGSGLPVEGSKTRRGLGRPSQGLGVRYRKILRTYETWRATSGNGGKHSQDFVDEEGSRCDCPDINTLKRAQVWVANNENRKRKR